MAGRSSTLITETATGMIYQNTSSSVQVCSINLCSTDETVNPSITIKLHTTNNVSLNQAVASSTPGGSVTRFLDGGSHQSTWGDAGNSFYFQDPTANTIRYQQGTGAIPASSNDERRTHRYTCIDPWMFINPSDYFDGKVTTFPYWYVRGSINYWWLDGSDLWANYNNMWIEGRTHTQSEAGPHTHPGNATATGWSGAPGYFSNNYPQCHDWYTAGTLAVNSNSYMTYAAPYLNNGNYTILDGGGTSNSTLYNIISSNNPINYDIDTPFCKMLQAERGVFVVTGGTWTSTNYCWFNPANNGNTNSNDMSGPIHFTEAANSGNRYLTTRSDSNYGGFRITQAGPEDFQWIKYNKTADKYYIASKSEGIFSAPKSTFFPNGGSFGTYTSFTAASAILSKEAEYPFGTDSSQQPSKIAQNLWVTITDQDALYYSTDLISWKTAAQYLESVFPAVPNPSSYSTLAVDNTGAAPTYYFGTGNWDKFESGIDSVPDSGLLEKSEQAGTFERTGVILAPGDCIYVENAASNAKIGATVMYVEV